LKGRITVVNWQLFAQPSVMRPARRVLAHERGHITCACGDEHRAEAHAAVREVQSAADREKVAESTTVVSASTEQNPSH
jgi:hypothetical protein